MNARRLALLIVVLSALSSGVALNAATGASSDGNRFEATFSETNASITNRIADLGVFQLINTGTGTVEGLGAAKVVLGVTQDRSVMPCGPGSWSNAAVQQSCSARGYLSCASSCASARRRPARSERAPGRSTATRGTGLFADARGSGEDHGQRPDRYGHARREAEASRLERRLKGANDEQTESSGRNDRPGCGCRGCRGSGRARDRAWQKRADCVRRPVAQPPLGDQPRRDRPAQAHDYKG